MTVYTYESLDRAVENGEAGTCISVNGARIIIPTACNEVVGFTNPDDLDPALKDRWRAGERGPEFENQKLMPGDCLVMYNNGRDMNKILEENPDWYKTANGIKGMIEKLYAYVDVGANLKEPAIWNSDLSWAKSVHLITSTNEEVTEEMWREKCGKAIESLKRPQEQVFIHLAPGDKLEERNQTAGGMSAIAVKQPNGEWNMVQLGAKGYIVVKENINSNSKNIYKETLENGTEIVREFETGDARSYEPKLKHYTRRRNDSHVRDFEDIEFKDGKIFNAKKDYSVDALDTDIKESYTIKEGKLEGEYNYEFSRSPNDRFIIKANFKEGVLDGDFLMEDHLHVIRKGHYDKGVFSGEHNPNEYLGTQKKEDEFLQKIDAINAQCWQSEKKDSVKELAESNNNEMAKLRNKLAQKVDKVLGTNLEKKELSKPLKKIEKAVSDKLFGKVKE